MHRMRGRFPARILQGHQMVALALVILGGVLGWRAMSGLLMGLELLPRPPGDPRFGWPLHLRERVNVLLIGTDVTLNTRRQVIPNLARADTLILMSFDPLTRTASFLSIPRDTRTSLPGHGISKINAAYAYGGVRLTVRAVEALLGVRVPYFLKMGADSFARLVDALGGVWVDVEKDMFYRDWWGSLTIDLRRGYQLLSGEQAMGYARFRMDALGDIGRIQRQQKVIRALFVRLREPQTLLRAPELVEWYRTRTYTNLSLQKVLTIAWFLRGLSSDRIRVVTLPGRFTPLFWQPDEARVREVVLEMFYGVDAQTVAKTGVEVRNASGVPGAAQDVAERLQRFGFPVIRVDGVPELRNQTAIVSHRGNAQLARAVREMVGTGALALRPSRSSIADLTVLVGRDYVRHQLVGLRPRFAMLSPPEP